MYFILFFDKKIRWVKYPLNNSSVSIGLLMSLLTTLTLFDNYRFTNNESYSKTDEVLLSEMFNENDNFSTVIKFLHFVVN